jgi:hypothetical protein
MKQLFSKKSNLIFRLALLLFGLLPIGALAFWTIVKWSPWETEVGAPVAQPIPFSHKHHVGGLGIDCRYCHTSVTQGAFAGIPATHTCMTCHSQIWQNASILEPLRRSYARQELIQWNRVYRLPKYVYFNHSIHVNKGIGCTECHGRMDQMPLTWKVKSFYMRECLECHRNPEKYIRPASEVFNINWSSPPDQIKQGLDLIKKYHIPTHRLTDCEICHR